MTELTPAIEQEMREAADQCSGIWTHTNPLRATSLIALLEELDRLRARVAELEGEQALLNEKLLLRAIDGT